MCQKLRASGWTDLKIVMLTAKGRDTEVTKGLALGADAYVTKPFSTRELVDTSPASWPAADEVRALDAPEARWLLAAAVAAYVVAGGRRDLRCCCGAACPRLSGTP